MPTPRRALVRPIREECLNRLIPFGERRLRRTSMRHRTIANNLHMDYTAVGQTTHLAARMEQLLASPGTTLLTANTLRLAEE